MTALVLMMAPMPLPAVLTRFVFSLPADCFERRGMAVSAQRMRMRGVEVR